MNTTNPNDSASPYVLKYTDDEHSPGLTKREHFAGLALQGLCANSRLSTYPDILISIAVQMADHLINQLNQNNNGE